MSDDSRRVEGKLNIENAKIIYRNFAGEERQYNPAGKRNFCVVIENDQLVEDLLADGWNVKTREPFEEGDKPMHYLPVEVSYKRRPPRITIISSRGKTLLDEEAVQMLDYADIKNADLIINPYNWSMRDGSGVKAYLDVAYITIQEDVFADKYADPIEEDDLQLPPEQ